MWRGQQWVFAAERWRGWWIHADAESETNVYDRPQADADADSNPNGDAYSNADAHRNGNIDFVPDATAGTNRRVSPVDNSYRERYNSAGDSERRFRKLLSRWRYVHSSGHCDVGASAVASHPVRRHLAGHRSRDMSA